LIRLRLRKLAELSVSCFVLQAVAAVHLSLWPPRWEGASIDATDKVTSSAATKGAKRTTTTVAVPAAAAVVWFQCRTYCTRVATIRRRCNHHVQHARLGCCVNCLCNKGRGCGHWQ